MQSARPEMLGDRIGDAAAHQHDGIDRCRHAKAEQQQQRVDAGDRHHLPHQQRIGRFGRGHAADGDGDAAVHDGVAEREQRADLKRIGAGIGDDEYAEEADQERASIETQVGDLKESMRKRGSLSGAEQVLTELANMVKRRGANSAEQVARKETIDALLGDLAVAYQDRQTALENESKLLDAETARWSFYYTTRVSRAVTECAIINPGATQRKKQQ